MSTNRPSQGALAGFCTYGLRAVGGLAYGVGQFLRVPLLHLLDKSSRQPISSRAGDSCAAFGFAPSLTSCMPMARTNPVQFFQQVRSEVSKVTWPGRNEVVISTIMVLIMVLLASLFFLLADQVISWLVSMLLSIR
jgi:preprotein translocase subunit SecE